MSIIYESYHCSPKERVIFLIKKYNNFEYELLTQSLKLELKSIKDEIYYLVYNYEINFNEITLYFKDYNI